MGVSEKLTEVIRLVEVVVGQARLKPGLLNELAVVWTEEVNEELLVMDGCIRGEDIKYSLRMQLSFGRPVMIPDDLEAVVGVMAEFGQHSVYDK